MNKIIKIILIFIIIFFLSLYFSKYSSDYYEMKSNLTEEAIKNYEKDLKDGKNIVASNYLPEEKNYNNKVSKMGLGLSHLIENIVDNGFKYMMKYLDNSTKG